MHFCLISLTLSKTRSFVGKTENTTELISQFGKFSKQIHATSAKSKQNSAIFIDIRRSNILAVIEALWDLNPGPFAFLLFEILISRSKSSRIWSNLGQIQEKFQISL